MTRQKGNSRDILGSFSLTAASAKHVLIVKKHWWQQLHMALMLSDGRVLHPHYGEVDMDFYWRIQAVVGVYRVEAPNALPMSLS